MLHSHQVISSVRIERAWLQGHIPVRVRKTLVTCPLVDSVSMIRVALLKQCNTVVNNPLKVFLNIFLQHSCSNPDKNFRHKMHGPVRARFLGPGRPVRYSCDDNSLEDKSCKRRCKAWLYPGNRPVGKDVDGRETKHFISNLCNGSSISCKNNIRWNSSQPFDGLGSPVGEITRISKTGKAVNWLRNQKTSNSTQT
jgi:hypothetical protein